MRKHIPLILVFVFILRSAGGDQKQGLPQAWKKWLDEEVVYIITSKEKKVFLSLKSEKEREAFERAFWLQRDPTPGTPVNEFREEHYRRVRYADEFFGRGTVKLGRETDRGRIYIILGPAVDIQRFHETSANLLPCELWQYYGDTSLGLPSVFYVVFFLDMSSIDYRLYSPTFDGPQRLLRELSQGGYERYDAYQRIKQISAELAEASLSLIPGTGGDQNLQSSSLSSDILISSIHRLPEKKVKSEWADAFAKHSDIVSTDYSVNYVESGSVLFVHQEIGKNYLHAIIEPYKLSMNQYEDKIYAPLRLNVKISGLSGETVHQEEKSIPVEMGPEDFKKIERRLSAIGDVIPLVEGNFKIDILLRNTNSKEFSSAEGSVVSPSQGNPSLSPILFLFDEKSVAAVPETVPFLFHGHQLYPNTQRLYSKAEDLLIYMEIYNPYPQLEEGSFRTVVSDETKTWTTLEESLGSKPFLMKKIPLQDYIPGYYKVSVSLRNAAGEEVTSQASEFTVSHLAYVQRPWRFNKIYPPLHHAYHALIRSSQYLAMGKYDQAIHEIEMFYDRTNPHLEIAKILGRAYFQKKEYAKAIEILGPFKDVQEYVLLELGGKSYYALADYRSAVNYFKKALMVAGEVVEIINYIGHSYLKMNDSGEAVEYFERSLKLHPNQPEIQKIIEKIKRED